MQSKPLRVIEVHWLDIYQRSGWNAVADIPNWKPLKVRQPGYIVHETDDYIVLTDSITADPDMVGSITAIPRGCIMKPTRLCRK